MNKVDKKLLDKSVEETQEHRAKVFSLMQQVCDNLMKRAVQHDQSKLEEGELEYFAQAKDLKGLTYGSDEYFTEIKSILGPALKHHYENNRHHPEHHEKGFSDMSMIDKVEMLVDWKAATMRHADGDIKKSMEINQERYDYSDQEKEKMIQFLKDINLW